MESIQHDDIDDLGKLPRITRFGRIRILAAYSVSAFLW